MNQNDLIPHIDALKDVVDIQIDENQNIITFGRVGRAKFWKAVVTMAIGVAVVSYIVMHQTVEAVIIGFVIWRLRVGTCPTVSGLLLWTSNGKGFLRVYLT